MDSVLDAAFDRLMAEHERFRPSLDPSVSQGNVVDVAQLYSDDTVKTAIAASQHIFGVPTDKHAAQLWLFSLLGDALNPSVTAMVSFDVVPLLDIRQSTVFHRDDTGYWFGFHPHVRAHSVRESGRALALSVAPLIATVCRVSAMRPAPLWAVVVDALVQPAMAAGNEDFETLKALGVARELAAGLQEGVESLRGDLAGYKAGIPHHHFEQICDGYFAPIDAEIEPDYVVAHRVSCCMIYHSPTAGKCTSCPHQDKDVRKNALIAASESF